MKVAINGFGRIGRLVFRIIEDNPKFEIVAINDLTETETLEYLLKYDTAHGTFKTQSLSRTEDSLIVDGKEIKVFAEKDAEKLPWGRLGIDLVFECTGFYTSEEKAMAHIKAGAKKVLISAPGKGNMKTIVYNVNHETLDGTEKIISAASCTTNCLAPVLKILDDAYDIKRGFMTTVHAYTADQLLQDGPHEKGINSRRGRAAAENIVPASTGAASAIGDVMPKLSGKFDGIALRVPVVTGSIIDVTVELSKKVTEAEVNDLFLSKSNKTIGITFDPIVSSDVIDMTLGSLVDGLSTNILEVDGEQLVKVIAWYDNEVSYSNQMVRVAEYLIKFL